MDPDIIFFIIFLSIFFILYLYNVVSLFRKIFKLENIILKVTLLLIITCFSVGGPYYFFNKITDQESLQIGQMILVTHSLVIGINWSINLVNTYKSKFRYPVLMTFIFSIFLGAIPILSVYILSEFFEYLDLMGPCC